MPRECVTLLLLIISIVLSLSLFSQPHAQEEEGEIITISERVGSVLFSTPAGEHFIRCNRFRKIIKLI
jgi:hypothetical protein